MLMKPRRWLAYTVQLNDLLPDYPQIVDRFAESDIPLDGTFGSNTESGGTVPGLILAIGPGVEPVRLLEVLDLLKGFGQMFVTVHDAAEHSKVIIIGALNLCETPVVAIGDKLRSALLGAGASATAMLHAIEAEPKVRVLRRRESQGAPPGS